MIIATANSNRQAAGIIDLLVSEAKKASMSVLGTEGVEDISWAVVDLGSIVVHIMLPEAREFYQLEKLWKSFANSYEEIDTKPELST